MFSYRTSPVSLFDALSTLHQLQQQQYQEQLQAQRPKIIKKVETEDVYQIQFFKESGNFNSYEVKVLRTLGNSNVVNLVIESEADEFRKVFQFNLDDIDVRQIDWEYYQLENVLVLNIPKKVKYCADDFASTMLSSLLGPMCPPKSDKRRRRHSLHRAEKKAQRHEERKQRAAQKLEDERAEAETLAAKELERQSEAQKAEAERLEKEKAEAERLEKEKAEAKRLEKEKAEAKRLEKEKREAEKAAEAQRLEQQKFEEQKKALLRRQELQRQEFERQAELRKQFERQEAERRAARVAAEKQRRKEIVRARKEQEQHEEAYRRQLQAGQQFLASLFGAPVFPHCQPQFQFVNGMGPVAAARSAPAASSNTKEAKEPEKVEAATQEQPKVAPESEPEHSAESDSELTPETSETSDVLSDEESVPSKPAGPKRRPSLEEIEDEEFVMFRKKFGGSK